MKNGCRIIFTAALSFAASAAAAAPLAHPLLLLHGYNGGADTWSDMAARLEEVPRPDADGGSRLPVAGDMLVLEYYSASGTDPAALGCTTDTPIEDVAELARYAAEEWSREYSASRDAPLPFDVLCHSMGGLVFREILAAIQDEAREAALAAGRTNLAFTASDSAAPLFHRAVDLGTPHFGVNSSLGTLSSSYQATEMGYAHPYLWRLADAWFTRGASFDRMNFIAGCGATGTEGALTGNWPWDGLVCAVSATMLTGADEDFAARTAYVNRRHSTAIVYSSVDALLGMASTNDIVARLVFAAFSGEPTEFGDGTGRWTTAGADGLAAILEADGFGSADDCAERVHTLLNRALAFIRVEKDDGGAVEYDVGTFYNDEVVSNVRDAGGGDASYTVDQPSDAITNGCALVWLKSAAFAGEEFGFKIAEPWKLPSGCSSDDFKYYDYRTVYGGGARVFRSYPKHKGAYSPAAGATVGGAVDTYTAADLAAAGILASAEDDEGAAAALALTAPNGFTWALNLHLGLDAASAGPLAISSFALSPAAGAARVSLALGSRALAAGDLELFTARRLLYGSAPDALDSSLALPADPAAEIDLPADARFFRASLAE